jgi:hypothetical protein
MSRLEKAPLDELLDEYERAVADAEGVLAKMKTNLRLSPEPFSSKQKDRRASCTSSGKISLTFTWTPPDHQE